MPYLGTSRMIDIFIPVRNRFSTLRSTVDSCLLFIRSDRRLYGSRIIILDCNSSDINSDWIRSLPDEVLYAPCTENIPMSLNWERSFEYLSNPYLTFVGSDDALIYSREGIDSIVSSPNVDCFFWQKLTFFWPGTFSVKSPAIMNLPLPRQIPNAPCAVLTRVLSNKLPWNLIPSVYNGIVRSEYAKKIKRLSEGNIFFWNASPDLCSGIQLAKHDARCQYLPISLGVSGVSSYSNGFAFITRVPNKESFEFSSTLMETSADSTFRLDTLLSPKALLAQIILKDPSPNSFTEEFSALASSVIETDINLPYTALPVSGLRAKITNKLFYLPANASITDMISSLQPGYSRLRSSNSFIPSFFPRQIIKPFDYIKFLLLIATLFLQNLGKR